MARITLTDEVKAAIAEMHHAGRGPSGIAKALGCDRETVSGWLDSVGLRHKRKHRRRPQGSGGDEAAHYLPTPEEIAAACAEIRETPEWKRRHQLPDSGELVPRSSKGPELRSEQQALSELIHSGRPDPYEAFIAAWRAKQRKRHP